MRGGVGNGRDRCVKAIRLGITGRLLESQTKAARQDRGVYVNRLEHRNSTCRVIAIGQEKRQKRRIVGVVRGDQQPAVRREGHFIHPNGTTCGYHLLGLAPRRSLEVDHMQRTVAISGIEPPPVRGYASRAGGSVVYRRASFVEHNPLEWFI